MHCSATSTRPDHLPRTDLMKTSTAKIAASLAARKPVAITKAVSMRSR
jgi:hypothetical protein